MVSKVIFIVSKRILPTLFLLFPTEKNILSINIVQADIQQVMVHFGRQVPTVFLYLTPLACARIRTALKITDKSLGIWLDVGSKGTFFYYFLS